MGVGCGYFLIKNCISISFSQSSAVRFSRGMLQKSFHIWWFNSSIAIASASVTGPWGV